MAANQQIGLQNFRVLGIDQSPNTGIYMLGENVVAYFAGDNIVQHNLEAKEQRFLPYTDHARGGVKCVAVSPPMPQGQVLLAYSLELDSTIIYIVELTQLKRQRSITVANSTVSFTCLAFSSGGRYLIAMGSTDSQLFYFDLSNGSLVGQHKVTAGPTTGPFNSVVTCISFHPTDVNSICCSGKGIFRQLTKNDKGFSLKQSPTANKENIDFKSHIWVGDNRIITAAADGHVYCIEGSNYISSVNIKNSTNSPVTHLTPTPKGFACVTNANTLHFFEKQPDARLFNEVNIITVDETATISSVAMSPTDDKLIVLMNDSRLLSIPLQSTEQTSTSEPIATLLSPHHVGVITGIDVAFRKQLLVTCGEDRCVRVWNYDKMTCELSHFFQDQPLSVSFHPSGTCVLVGFPEKVRYMSITVDDLITQHEFPIRNCKELKFSHGGQYFAAVNGPNVQIYNSYTFKNITNIRSPGQGQRISGITWSTDDNVLVVCDMNGSIGQFNVRSTKPKAQQPATSYHFTSIVSTDAVGTRCYGITSPDNTLRELEDLVTKSQLDLGQLPSQLVMGPSNRCIFVSMKTGTIRIYHFPGTSNSGANFPSPDNMTENIAHQSAVTALVASPDYQYLFSAGEDGCVYMMKITGVDLSNQRADTKIVFSEDVLIARSENVEQLKKLRAAQQRVREQTETNSNKLNAINQSFAQKLKEIKEKFKAEEQAEKQNLKTLEDQISQMNEEAKTAIETIQKQNAAEEEQKAKRFAMSKENEKNQQEQLKKDIEVAKEEWARKVQEATEEHQRYREELERKNEQQIQELRQQTSQVIAEKQKLIEEFDQWEVEQGNELAFETGKREFEALKLREKELKANAKLEAESKKMDEQLKAAKQAEQSAKAQLQTQMAEVATLQQQIAAATHQRDTHTNELKELRNNLDEKNAKIEELKKNNSNLSKHKQLLVDRINEWNKKLEPNQAKKQDISITCERMQQEMQRYIKNDEELKLEANELRLKISAKRDEIERKTKELDEVKQMTRQFKLEVHKVYQTLLQDENNDIKKRKGFKPALAALYRKYVGDESTSSLKKTGVTDIQVERNRERDALERNITAVSRRISRGDEEHARQHNRMMEENVTLMTQISELNRQNENLRKRKRMLEESSKSMYSAEELNKILEMMKGRVAQLTEQLKQLQLRGNVSRKNPMSRSRLPPMNP